MVIKPRINLEKKTNLWLGLLILVLSIVYVLATLGRTSWTAWIAIIFGLFLTIFLIIEGGIITYFQKKDYKRLGFGDAVVWVTAVVAAIIFINTLLLFNFIKQQAPEWLINFAGTTGIITGVIAGILAIVYIFYPRFK